MIFMNLTKIRQFHGKLYENRLKYKKAKQLKGFVKYPKRNKVFFIGTPEYDNLGDSAIAVCQMLFLEKCGFQKDCIKEFTQSEFEDNKDILVKLVKKDFLICLIGGGNIGNEWYNEELFRYSVIDTFPQNPIIIFPQTVYFSDDNEGRKALKKSCREYNSVKNLTIVAREKKSFESVCEYYKYTNMLLTPDIVLFSDSDTYGLKPEARKGILCVFRNDSEKSLSDDKKNTVFSFLNQKGIYYRITDMYADEYVTKENRFLLVKNKLMEFTKAELVITDRLHGMIFSAISGTPCIVFSNYNHKVQGTYEWIKYLSYIRYVTDVNDALRLIPELMKMSGVKYDKKPLLHYFDELEKEIKKYVD